MVTAELSDRDLVVELTGVDRMLTLRRRLRVPRDDIRRAWVDGGIAGSWAPRLAGVGLRGWIPMIRFAGDLTYPGASGRELWAVRPDDRAVLVVELHGAAHRRLVLSVDKAAELARRLATEPPTEA